MQIGNRRPDQAVYKFTQVRNCVAIPAIANADTGAFSISFRCHQPTFVSPYSAASSLRVGQIFGKETASAIDGQAIFEANGDCETAFSNYDKFCVIKSAVEVRCAPLSNDLREVPLVGTNTYCRQARWLLTLSRDKLVHGTTVPAIIDTWEANNLPGQAGWRRTSQARTQWQEGTRPVGCSLAATYTPHRTYWIKDLRDNLPEFDADTSGAYTTDPDTSSDPVTNQSYWTLTCVPDRPTVKDGSTEPPTIVNGVPMPHRVMIKHTYYVLMMSSNLSENRTLGGFAADSMNFSAASSMAMGATAAAMVAAGAKRGFDAAFNAGADGVDAFLRDAQRMRVDPNLALD